VFNLLVAAANRRDAAAESRFFWKSDHLVSVAQGTPTLGWDARDLNARQWYGSLARQKIVPGQVETRALGADAVALLATYEQEIEAKDGRRWEGEGVWSLVFRRMDGSWVVVWEHYSYERP
jgi:ketosteroid isomerase-like protein